MSRYNTRQRGEVDVATERHSTPVRSSLKKGYSPADEIRREVSKIHNFDNSDWNVIVEYAPRCTINLYETEFQSTNVSSQGRRFASRQVTSDSSGPNADQIVHIILEYILLKKSKPKRILFDDNSVHSRTLPSLSNIKYDISNANRTDSNSPSLHFGETLILPRFTVVGSQRLNNELNGVTVALVERGSDVKTTASTRSRPRTNSASSSSPRSATIEKSHTTTSSGGTSYFTYFIGIVFVAAAIAFAYHYIPDSSIYWPLPQQEVNEFYKSLKSDFTSQPQLASNLRRTFASHTGSKPLTVHLIGQTDSHADSVIQHISNLINKGYSDQVVYLSGNEEQNTQTVFQSVKKRPNTIFVIDTASVNPQSLDFLAAALDENYPHVNYQGESVKTTATTFVFVSQMRTSSAQEMEDFDLLAKKHLKSINWPDRLCQRVRQVVPLM